MSETVIEWRDIKTTLDINVGDLDPVLVGKAQKRLAEIMEDRWREIFSAAQPPAPKAPPCKCRGPFFHDASCPLMCC